MTISRQDQPGLRTSLPALAVFLILCFAAAGIGGAVTAPKIDTWYATLVKPSFNPPNWVFGPVWTLLFGLMAIAAWRVWRTDPKIGANRRALVLFGAQLLFNVGWSIAFFGAENPLAGLLVILVLEALIVMTIRAFLRHDRPAAWMLVPYAAWVGFATLLNLTIYSLN